MPASTGWVIKVTTFSFIILELQQSRLGKFDMGTGISQCVLFYPGRIGSVLRICIEPWRGQYWNPENAQIRIYDFNGKACILRV
jgi:hypothetical protein